MKQRLVNNGSSGSFADVTVSKGYIGGWVVPKLADIAHSIVALNSKLRGIRVCEYDLQKVTLELVSWSEVAACSQPHEDQ